MSSKDSEKSSTPVEKKEKPQKIEKPKPEKLDAKEFDKRSQIETNFKILKKYEDPRFGRVAIIEVPGNNRRLMCKEKIFNSKSEATNEIITAKKRLQAYSPHLLALVDYSTGVRSDFCASFYWMKLYFEYPDNDLEMELRKREKSSVIGMTSFELTHLLYNSILGGAELHKRELYHGNICPRNIEMDNPQAYKLIERFGDLAMPEVSSYNTIKRGAETYASPEFYAYTAKNNLGKNRPALGAMQQSDVFSLGATLLHCGNDDSIQKIYDKNGGINTQNLQEAQQAFAQKFAGNNLLVSTVMAMTNLDNKARPASFVQMLGILPPYNVVTNKLTQSQSQLNQSANYSQYANTAQWEKNWVPASNLPVYTKYAPQAQTSPLPQPAPLLQSQAGLRPSPVLVQSQGVGASSLNQRGQQVSTQPQHNFGVVPRVGQPGLAGPR